MLLDFDWWSRMFPRMDSLKKKQKRDVRYIDNPYYVLADNFRPSQSQQPNFDYPQMHNNQKIIFVTSKRIDPLNAEQLSCSQKAVNAATEGHDYEAQLWGVL